VSIQQELYRTEVERSEKELQSRNRIIDDYKDICKRGENMLEDEKNKSRSIVEKLRAKTKSCSTCSTAVDEAIYENDSTLPVGESADVSGKQNDLTQRMADLQAELIETKLRLAEAEARNDVSYLTY